MKKGIIITNLPEHCRDCDFYGIKCRITGEMCKYYSENGRPESCPIREIPDYEDLEEQNKLLRLPCTVGDTVYEVQYLRKRIQPYIIITVHVSNCGNFYEWELKDGKGIYGNVNGFSEYALGKSVFLAYEEAKAALKEIGECMG